MGDDNKRRKECFLFMENVTATIKAERRDKQPDPPASVHGISKIRGHLQQFTGKRTLPDYGNTKDRDRRNHR